VLKRLSVLASGASRNEAAYTARRLRDMAASGKALGPSQLWVLACCEAKLAGLPTIESKLLECDDRTALHVTVVENLQRQDLSPLEEARGVRALLDGAWPVEEIAAAYEAEHGVRVQIEADGSGKLLSKIRIAPQRGDLFLALGRYNGSRGRAEYPNAVFAAQRQWQLA
jgi:hypothetical protein